MFIAGQNRLIAIYSDIAVQKTGPATDLQTPAHAHIAAAEWRIDILTVAIITAVSIFAMLVCASPELWWDEADYVAKTAHSWGFLWGTADYDRHQHGPMAIYLAKFGLQLLPASVASIESRLRFFETFLGSLAIGLLYYLLRQCFGASRSGALAGSALLLFSVIRLQETNIVGPHHAMLLCTLLIFTLGYYWRDRASSKAAVILGIVLGFGAVAMTYVIPIALCWIVAVAITGREWIEWDSRQLKISGSVFAMLLVAAIFVLALWPPGIIHSTILSDFRHYLHYPLFPTLVGNRIYPAPPRWAFLWWMARLDAPILIGSASVITIAMWRAYRRGEFSSKHAWLAVCIGFMIGVALAAHIAGARNLLQVIGVVCIATGALFDEVFAAGDHLFRRMAAAVVILAAISNLLWLARASSYIPYPSTDGYRAFVRQNAPRLNERV